MIDGGNPWGINEYFKVPTNVFSLNQNVPPSVVSA
jgi:hypothetical protein